MQNPPYDDLIVAITDYVLATPIQSQLAYQTAHWCLFDSLGCAILALQFRACTQLLGPVVPGALLAGGARVPGTTYALDPVQAAFNIGTMIRWLDFNDAWLAAEWGHPSDNLGGILAVADYTGRQSRVPLRMGNLLTLLIKAYEIQGVLALNNSFNRHGLDHVVLVKLATAAVVSVLLGGDRDFLYRTLSQVFVDGQSLRTYRQAPNTGSRKSWAAGDATARAVRLALLSQAGEMGYPTALTTPTWGFYDVLLTGKPLILERPLDAYVMENILFKLPYPTEFHAQTAVECAINLHPSVDKRWDDIARIRIITHEAAMRIIVKEGVLRNPADRDHCLQYMVAVALLYGELTAEHYADAIATDPRIDSLRSKMAVCEDRQFSADYLDPSKRSIANAIEITWRDGSQIPLQSIAYPLGHPRRRAEALPQLKTKCQRNLATHFAPAALNKLLNVMDDFELLCSLSVVDFMALWVSP